MALDRGALLSFLGTYRPPPAPPTSSTDDDEAGFRSWYEKHARQWGLDPDPDNPEHKYDYRAAYRAGEVPDPKTGHWPSTHKADDHPNRYIGIVDTKTGKPAPAWMRSPAPAALDVKSSVASFLQTYEPVPTEPVPRRAAASVAPPASRPASLARIPAAPAAPVSVPEPLTMHPTRAQRARSLEERGRATLGPAALPTAEAATANLYEEPTPTEAGVEAWQRGVANVGQALGGLGEMVGRALQPEPDTAAKGLTLAQQEARARARDLYSVGAPPSPATGILGAALGSQAEQAGLEAQAATAITQEALPRPEYAQDFFAGLRTDPFKTLAVSGLENLPTLVSTLGAAAVGGPAGGLAMAGAQEAGAAYNEARESGATEEEARSVAGWVGATNMVLEYLPAGKLLAALKGGADRQLAKSAVRLIFEQGMAEGGTESVQELNGVLARIALVAGDQGMTLEEVARRVGEAGISGFVLGLAGGAGATSPRGIEAANARSEREAGLLPRLYPDPDRGIHVDFVGRIPALRLMPPTEGRPPIPFGPKGEPLPLPRLDDRIAPEAVEEAWAAVSSRYPMLAGHVLGIQAVAGLPETQPAMMSGNGVLGISTDFVKGGGKLTPEILGHELAHLAQYLRNPEKTNEDLGWAESYAWRAGNALAPMPASPMLPPRYDWMDEAGLSQALADVRAQRAEAEKRLAEAGRQSADPDLRRLELEETAILGEQRRRTKPEERPSWFHANIGHTGDRLADDATAKLSGEPTWNERWEAEELPRIQAAAREQEGKPRQPLDEQGFMEMMAGRYQSARRLAAADLAKESESIALEPRQLGPDAPVFQEIAGQAMAQLPSRREEVENLIGEPVDRLPARTGGPAPRALPPAPYPAPPAQDQDVSARFAAFLVANGLADPDQYHDLPAAQKRALDRKFAAVDAGPSDLAWVAYLDAHGTNPADYASRSLPERVQIEDGFRAWEAGRRESGEREDGPGYFWDPDAGGWRVEGQDQVYAKEWEAQEARAGRPAVIASEDALPTASPESGARDQGPSTPVADDASPPVRSVADGRDSSHGVPASGLPASDEDRVRAFAGELGRRPKIPEIQRRLGIGYGPASRLWKASEGWDNPTGETVAPQAAKLEKPAEPLAASGKPAAAASPAPQAPPSPATPPGRPAWLAAAPGTKKGKGLVSAIRKDETGERMGVRAINDYLLWLTGSEMRVGREQTTRRRPAHYEPGPHMVRARTGSSITYGAHEAGHALSALLRDSDPKLYAGLKPDLLDIANRPDSYASAKSPEEGMAEWVRRYVAEPETVAGLHVTATLESRISALRPQALSGLRDAARAFDAHRARPFEARYRSFSTNKPAPKPRKVQSRDLLDRVLFETASRRRAVHRIENQVWEAVRDHVDGERTLAESLRKAFLLDTPGSAKARQVLARVRSTPADFELAYQSTIHILPETLRLVDGTEGGKQGVRAVGPDGDWVYYSDKSLADVVAAVGEEAWPAFDVYGRAKANLARAEAKGAKFPGATSGETAADLKSLVEASEAANQKWEPAFRDIEGMANGLLEMAVDGGLVTREAADAMLATYGAYWPLLKEAERGNEWMGGGTTAVEIDPGFRRASGEEGGPELPIVEGMRRRARGVMSAYYWNRAALAPAKLAERIAKDKDVPLLAKAAASRIAVRLMPGREASRKVATLSPEEAAREIADYVNATALARARGIDLTSEDADPDSDLPIEEVRELDAADFEEETGQPKVMPGDVNIWWRPGDVWRRASPKDTAVNVVVAREAGEPVFLQIEDPVLYDLFARARNPSDFFGWYGRLMGGLVNPWKKAITQTLAFVAGNLPRDAITAITMGQGAEAMVPGYYGVAGLVNHLTHKEGNAASEAELLARSFDYHLRRPAHQTRWAHFKNLLAEGVILDGWREMNVIEKATTLPGQMMAAAMKPIEVALWATGQRRLAELSEAMTREGAYVTIKKKGGSDEAAQLAYDMITGNFGETPGNPDIGVLYKSAGFLNPMVQGTYELGRRATHPDPRIRRATYARLGYVGLLSAAGWAINALITPDEKEEEMAERTDEERFGFMPIGGWFRIPFNPGVPGAIQSWVWNMLDARFGDAPPVVRKKQAKLLLTRALDMPGDPLAFMNPQLKTVIENQANYKFYFDRPIEAWWMERMPAADRVYPDTPDLYRNISKVVEGEVPVIGKWGPLKIQHFVQAGVSDIADSIIRAADRHQKGLPIAEQPADLPFVGRRFTRRPGGFLAASVKRVEEAEARYSEAKAALKKLDEAATPPSPAEIAALELQMDQLEALHDAMEEIRDLGKEAREARAAGDLKSARSSEKTMIQVAQDALKEAGRPK